MIEPVRVEGDSKARRRRRSLSFRPADDLGESRRRLSVERWGEGRGLGGGRGRRVARGDEGLGRGVVGLLLRGTRAAENECQRCRERESQQRTFGNHASNVARCCHDRVAVYCRCHRWSTFFHPVPLPLGSKPGSSLTPARKRTCPRGPEARFSGSPAWIEAHHRNAARPIPARLP